MKITVRQNCGEVVLTTEYIQDHYALGKLAVKLKTEAISIGDNQKELTAKIDDIIELLIAMNTTPEPPVQTPSKPPSPKQVEKAYRAYKKSLKKDISLKRKYLNEQNRKWPVSPIQVPEPEWPKLFESDKARIAVWRSCDYLIQVFRVRDGLTRLSINRTELDDQGRFKDHITWEELMWLKEACGYGDKDAVEVLPRTIDVVDVAHLRHVWVFDELQDFVWRIQDKPAATPADETK